MSLDSGWLLIDQVSSVEKRVLLTKKDGFTWKPAVLQRMWTHVPKNPFPLVSQGAGASKGEFQGYTRGVGGPRAEQHSRLQQSS